MTLTLLSQRFGQKNKNKKSEVNKVLLGKKVRKKRIRAEMLPISFSDITLAFPFSLSFPS